MVLTALVRKDLQRLVGDRRALIVNLALPLLLTTIMGLSFGNGGGSGISAIPVAMVAGEMPGFLKERLADGLQQSGFFTVTWADSLAADQLVRAGDVAAAIVLPDDLWTRLIDGERIGIGLWKDPGSTLKAGIVEEILSRMLVRYQAGEAAYESLWPEDRAAGAGDEKFRADDYFSGDFNAVWKRFRAADDDPVLQGSRGRFMTVMDHQVALSDAMSVQQITLSVNDKAPVAAQDNKKDTNLFNYFLPSFAVFFLMFAVAAGARDIHREREHLTLQRQLLSPVGSTRFVVGKWLAATAQGILQLTVLFGVGAMVFHVNLGPDPYTLLVMIILTSAAAASVFVLLALLTPTEKIMDNLSTVVILVSAMVGGNFVPVDALPPWVHGFGRFVFNYWANRGFTEVVVRDQSLGAIILPLLVLGSAALTLFVVNVGIFTVRARRGGLA